ncbi:hypothetical protein E5198_13040 [Pseudomonas sp. A-1]|uniref:P-loop ATPase, Sll1717 family n=1 Tax=Pseudomonas sp. A-1 TaxID=1821274 RepID=UPI0010A5DF31|nr:hypothetical protein [Pseudomonas sp. A-1]THG81137.1 hypothetical protein E5198_13040 [Pseudomonas sp. A-1]
MANPDSSPCIEDLMDALEYYVPTGTAEGEKLILEEAFVQTHEYADIIAPPIGSPRLLVGKKGSGKSAILDFTMRFLSESNIPGILIKPMHMDLSSMGENSSSGELTRIAYETLLKSISRGVATQLTGLVVGDNKLILQDALDAGTKDADFFSKFANLLNSFSSPFTGYDFSKILKNTSPEKCRKLERAVKKNIEKSGSAFYLLIDDTDQVANPGTPNHLNRIWACILAARELTQNNPKVRCVISLRDEIWRRLENEGSAQRDQIDHFQPLVYKLNPTLDHVQSIIEKRLILAACKAGSHTDRPDYSLFFKGSRPRMPNSETLSSWPDIIKSRSRERPRDAVQLVGKMASLALQGEPKKIDENILSTVMPEYSKERAGLVAGEYADECPKLLEVIRMFHKLDCKHGAFLADAETVKTHLTNMLGGFSVEINGIAIRPDRDDDVFKLWNLLFEAGFFYPRVSDRNQPDGYRFVYPHEEPGLVDKQRWNDIQKSLWEIHPVFRDYLIAEQRKYKSQFGLATKRKTRK